MVATIENQIFNIFSTYVKSNHDFVVSTAYSAFNGPLTLEAYVVGEIAEYKTVEIKNYLAQKISKIDPQYIWQIFDFYGQKMDWIVDAYNLFNYKFYLTNETYNNSNSFVFRYFNG